MTYDQCRRTCLCPRLIFSPRLKFLTQTMSHIMYFRSRYPISDSQRLRIIKDDKPNYCKILHLQSPRSIPVGCDYLDNVYLCNDDNECANIYEYVPCGKCDACLDKKVQSYVSRCQMAIEESKTIPIFLTFSFKDSFLPNQVDPSLIQKFLKRIRKNLHQLEFQSPLNVDFDKINLKYFCVPEFGGKTKRLHFHMLLFGFPRVKVDDNFNNLYTAHYFEYCYRDNKRDSGKGFTSFKEYRFKYPIVFKRRGNYDPNSFGWLTYKPVLTTPSKCVSYITKYITKNYADESFYRTYSSINLGVNFVKSHLLDIQHHPHGKLSYREWFSGKYKSVYLSSYYIKKLFPSLCASLPVRFTREFLKMWLFTEKIIHDKVNYNRTYRDVMLFVQDYYCNKFPFYNLLPMFDLPSYKSYYDEYGNHHILDQDDFYELKSACEFLDNLDIDFSQVLENDKNLSEHILKLSMIPTDDGLADVRAICFRQCRSSHFANSVL